MNVVKIEDLKFVHRSAWTHGTAEGVVAVMWYTLFSCPDGSTLMIPDDRGMLEYFRKQRCKS